MKLHVFGIWFAFEVYLFNWFYGFIPFFTALVGIFIIAKHWGGFRSLVGRGIIFISCGLLGQWVGLQIWTYYNLIARVEVPYPSFADIGYFALIPFYSFGAFSLARAVGSRFVLRTLHGNFSFLLSHLSCWEFHIFFLFEKLVLIFQILFVFFLTTVTLWEKFYLFRLRYLCCCQHEN